MILLLAAACGKKADPMLPVHLAPEQVKGFQAVARSGAIVLAWKAPAENTDNSPLIDLAGFKIFREELPVAKACQQCPRNFTEFFDYPYRGSRGKQPEKTWFIYHDRTVTTGNLYTYRIHCYNERETTGPASKLLSLCYDVPPAAPAKLQARRDGRLIVLAWEHPGQLEDGSMDRIEGYNVYRSLQQGQSEQIPLNQELVKEPVLEDIPETYDRTYYYTVRAVRRSRDTLIESLPSEEIAVPYMDITPPGIPQALTAIPQEDGILLKWMPKVEQGFAGFNLYRKAGHEPGFVRLNDRLITQGSWLDRSVQLRARYIYAVTAVDRSAQANESPYSDIVEVLYILK